MSGKPEKECYLSKLLKDDNRLGSGILNSRKDLEEQFYRIVDFYMSNNRHNVPRHGLFSVVARQTGFYLFDHPALTQLCDTGFTQGTGVFVNTQFFEDLMVERERGKQRGVVYNDIEFLLTHEMRHMMDLHFSRLTQYSNELANIAQDMRINITIVDMFPEWTLSGFMTNGVGFTEKERELFSGDAEETIARKLLAMAERKNKEQSNQNSGQSNKEGSEGQPQAGKEDRKGQPQSGQSGMSQNNEGVAEVIEELIGQEVREHDHVVTPEDFVNALQEGADKDLLEKLGIPENMDNKAKAKIAKEAEQKLRDAVAETKRTRNENPNGQRMPGQHMEDDYQIMLDSLTKPKLTFKTAFKQAVYGDGMQMDPTDDVPDMLYFVDPDVMNMSMNVYLPGVIPATRDPGNFLFVIDTSSSNDAIDEMFSEALGALDSEEMQGARLFVASADTRVRGKVWEVTLENKLETVAMLSAFGGGGTDLLNGVKTAYNYIKEMHSGLEISACGILTDLGDTPPRYEQLPEDIPAYIYICAPHHYDERFAAAVEHYAEVARLEEGAEVDLEALTEKTAALAP